MVNTTKIETGKLIDCPAMFNEIIEGLGDLSETKKFYIFYASDNANTISYIKSMGRITKYNIEIKIINMKDISAKDFIKVSSEINEENSKYIALKPMEDKIYNKLRFALNYNEVDTNDKLTVEAVCYILNLGLKITSKECLILGRHLGLRIGEKLLEMDYTPQIAHSKTKDLDGIMKKHNLIISATGKKGLIKADMVTEGTTVIDVGLGDIEEDAYDKCLVTPRVNGVGLITTAMLIKEIRG